MDNQKHSTLCQKREHLLSEEMSFRSQIYKAINRAEEIELAQQVVSKQRERFIHEEHCDLCLALEAAA